MANCGKDTNGSQFNFQEPCQWLIVVKILMVQFNFQERCQWLIVVRILMVHSLLSGTLSMANCGRDTNGSV